MANKYPLQAGDITPDFSGRDSSPAADRRAQETASVQSNQGSNYASATPASVLWQPGQVAPVKHTPPFDTIRMEGDTSGDGTEIFAIDIYSYGDCHDPKAPTRINDVTSEWASVDTDFDGAEN